MTYCKKYILVSKLSKLGSENRSMTFYIWQGKLVNIIRDNYKKFTYFTKKLTYN